MPVTLKIEIDGVPQFNRAFNRVQEHIEDLRPVWEEVEPAFYAIEEQQFKSEGSKGGGAWKKLSPLYAKRKEKIYPGQPILQAKGTLYDSLTSKTANTTVIKEKQEFGIGTSLFYAMFHQRGTKKMPKRPPIDFGSDQKRDLGKAMQKGLLEILKRDPSVRSVVDFN